MKRDTAFNILLIIMGILLALALFGAGAVWKSRMQPSRPSVSAPAAEKDRSLANKKPDSEESMPESENVASNPAVSVVVTDDHRLR
jgi:FtsZ-interacting cell division protein ZipA